MFISLEAHDDMCQRAYRRRANAMNRREARASLDVVQVVRCITNKAPDEEWRVRTQATMCAPRSSSNFRSTERWQRDSSSQ